MNAYLHSLRKPLKACADHTRADSTRLAATCVVPRTASCLGLSSESLKRKKLSVWAGKSRRGWPISFHFTIIIII